MKPQLNLCLQGKHFCSSSDFSNMAYQTFNLRWFISDTVTGYFHVSDITHGRSPILIASALLLHGISNTAPSADPSDSCHFGRCHRLRPRALKIPIATSSLLRAWTLFLPTSKATGQFASTRDAASRFHLKKAALLWAHAEASTQHPAEQPLLPSGSHCSLTGQALPWADCFTSRHCAQADRCKHRSGATAARLLSIACMSHEIVTRLYDYSRRHSVWEVINPPLKAQCRVWGQCGLRQTDSKIFCALCLPEVSYDLLQMWAYACSSGEAVGYDTREQKNREKHLSIKKIHGNIFTKLILTDFRLHLTLLTRDICICKQ